MWERKVKEDKEDGGRKKRKKKKRKRKRKRKREEKRRRMEGSTPKHTTWDHDFFSKKKVWEIIVSPRREYGFRANNTAWSYIY